jgi:hypothetical protein
MRLTLEDGWATIADGLHIHRWFLHVEPHLEELERARYERMRAQRAPTFPDLSQARGTWSKGALEHLTHPDQPDDPVPPGRPRPRTIASSRLCGKDVILANMDSVVSGAGDDLVVKASLLVEGMPDPPVGQEALDRVSHLVDVASLTPMVQLTTDVVVNTDETTAADHSEPSSRLLRTIYVSPSDVPHYGEQIVAAAVGRLLRGFLDWNPVQAQERSWWSPSRRRPVPRAAFAWEVLATALRHRYLTRILAHPEARLCQYERSACRFRLEQVRLLVDQLVVDVYDLAESFNELVLYDLVTTLFPGPRQFDKYRRGIGAGQSE